MMKTLIIALFTICCFVNFAYSQKLTEPTLVGGWAGGDDFGEFIYHRTDTLNRYLKANPNGKIVARLCSKNKMSLSLVSSVGFAFQFFNGTRNQAIPDQNVYLARSSKCADKTEEYWFVPENTTLDFDEIILAKNVEVKRLIEDYHENPESQLAKKEFANNTKNLLMN